ncbi:MAG TPA: hypothetical protein VHD56_05495 [Tepidisphaeraceae bacterium]|nr:hypothetical protein [Tepidisphaeraceae bacterium]
MTSALLAQPAGVSRVLRNFDFEERRLGNAEDLPMHWSKVEGTGLPHYVNGRLSNDRAHSGNYSFRFDLNGGSLIYRYDQGQIPVQPGAHYRVEGFVQTTALTHARARITTYFANQDGEPMLSTIRHSDLFASAPGDTTWHPIGVEISASLDFGLEDPDHPRQIPKTLIIELELLQPMHYAASSLGSRTLYQQDIHGSAWFDDVNVSQVPKVNLSTEKPGNIFRRSDPLLLKVLVNDRFTDDLAAQLVITDANGNAVYQRSGALDMSAAQNLGPGQKRMTLALPPLPPGWYEAAMVMTSKNQFVGRQKLDLVLLADDAAGGTPDPRFGIIATDLPSGGWEDLPQILTMLSAGRVKLGVWDAQGDVEQTDASSFDRLLESLTDHRIEPTACLIALPPQIASKVLRTKLAISQSDASIDSQAAWAELLKCDPQLWQPQLSYLIARHATHLERWQLGEDGSDDFVTHPQMRQVYSLIYNEFAKLIEKPDLAMPWPAWYELDGQLPATVALHVKPDVLPAQVPLYVKDMQTSAASAGKKSDYALHNLSTYLEPLNRDQYGRDAQIRDLAQRIVYALSADARRIDLKLPFTVSHEPAESSASDSESIVKQPQELLIVVRTVMSMLSGATFKGNVPIAEGVEAFLFDRNGQGVMVLWDRGVAGSVKQLNINLGEHPRQVDLWGNVRPLTRARGEAAVQIDIGPMPIFLLDIDGQLAQLRASVAFDNPLLESSFKPHTRKIRFTNPYKQGISGSFKLTAPPGWVINPPTMNFSLNPGEVFEREITVEFPYNSFAGLKTISAEFQVQADNNSTFTLPLVLKLGLSDVGLQSLALRDGTDVIVQQMITNYGDHPIDYTAYAIYPGQQREERFVTNLAPGRTTIKKYRFVNVKITPNIKVRSGLKETDGTRILNDEVPIQ